MTIKRLDITDVRNISKAQLSGLCPINLFYGLNGSGKTTILESIHLLSVARSFRSHKLTPLINRDSQACVVYAEIATPSGGYQPVGVRRSRRDGAEIKLGGKVIRSAAQLAESLPVQVINSETFQLLEGSPSGRRQFLDWGVFHVEHHFHDAWKTTQRCLKQRNSLLRHGRIDGQQMAVWTAELVKNGERLDQFRQHYIEQFIPVFNDCLSKLIDLDGIELRYNRGWDKDRPLADVLVDAESREREQGHTLSGPHRADIRIKYKGATAADLLSRGQQKLVVCAMRVAQGQLLTQLTGRQCVFLVDDLPSELDHHHRTALCQLLEVLSCQVFVTCVDHRDLDRCWSGNKDIAMFHVEHGEVSLK